MTLRYISRPQAVEIADSAANGSRLYTKSASAFGVFWATKVKKLA
jgi:hypothetical protein